MAFKRVTAKVDLDAIANNYAEIKRSLPPQTKIMGIIKADAYGHGALPVATELERQNIDMFGVATIQEAVSLRKNGITKPMLILGYTGVEDYADLIEFDLIQTVYEKGMALRLHEIAEKFGKKAKIHIKVDTGMGRLGFDTDRQAVEDVKMLAMLPYLQVDGVFTHFSKADEIDPDYTQNQILKLNGFIRELKEQGICIPEIHAANSAGILNHPQAVFTMVRAGIILYGCYPSEYVNADIQLRPALSVCAKVIFLKKVPMGKFISYGGIYQTEKETVIATVSIGYADGYSRLLSNKGRVLIHGKYARVIGRVCMDQLMIDVSDIENVEIGDEVVLFGEQSGQKITIEEIATESNTINYEVMCLIGKRVPREYYKGGTYQFEVDYFDILETGLHIR